MSLNVPLATVLVDVALLRRLLPLAAGSMLKRALARGWADEVSAKALLCALLPTWPHDAAWFSALAASAQACFETQRAELEAITERRHRFAREAKRLKMTFKQLREAVPPEAQAGASQENPFVCLKSAEMLQAAVDELGLQLAAAYKQHKLLGLIPWGGHWHAAELAEGLARLLQAEARLLELRELEAHCVQAETARLELRGQAIASCILQQVEASLRVAAGDATF